MSIVEFRPSDSEWIVDDEDDEVFLAVTPTADMEDTLGNVEGFSSPVKSNTSVTKEDSVNCESGQL